jgi:alpha-L-rhamnosidase
MRMTKERSAGVRTNDATILFQAAVPVWLENRDISPMNVLAGFRSIFTAPGGCTGVLRITGASIYRVSVNGRFAAHGPARTAHGFARVDELLLDDLLVPGCNLLAIEVAGYEVNSYYVAGQPSFLQAEVILDGRVVAATGGKKNGFEALRLPERLQRVQRLSWQRAFIEAYRLQPDHDAWKRDADRPLNLAPLQRLPLCRLLPRGVPFPEFSLVRPSRIVSTGTMQPCSPANIRKDRSLTNVATVMGFEESDLNFVLSTELQCLEDNAGAAVDQAYEGAPLDLPAGHWTILDFGRNRTGFIGLKLFCAEPTRLVPVFDEILVDGKVQFDRLCAVAALSYELSPGIYDLESLEPYTFRYLRLQTLTGRCRVDDVYVREMVNPDAAGAVFSCSDQALEGIFEAGRETFRQNALDLFMDCPSRERAGWLCDSFFTGRAEMCLCGHNRVERNFLENFLLPESFAKLPPGMLPMCYPADHPNGRFIPNWALWFVIELEEYLARSSDHALVAAFQPKAQALFDYFSRFKNADGLLEKLESWVFIEWSNANQFVQDVNYPSNMLYAGALAAAGRLYGNAGWAGEAEQVARTIRAQSYDGTFFVDNAVRTADGRLEITRNRSETCQYYAFFFHIATPSTHPELWQRLVRQFGPVRKTRDDYPEIHPSNAFIGEYLRFELLARHGEAGRMLNEMKAFLGPMAERTGTLWENLDPSASCNHAFASHACHALLRDALGIVGVDTAARTVRVRAGVGGLEWCQGHMPVAGGLVEVAWRREGGRVQVRVTAPDGYVVDAAGVD